MWVSVKSDIILRVGLVQVGCGGIMVGDNGRYEDWKVSEEAE